MLDLATLKSAVDLFKELIGLLDERNKKKRELFERICRPLYDRLELIFKEYYATLAAAVSDLNKPEPDLEGILQEMNKHRASFIVARNGILGEAEALAVHYGKGDKLDGLVITICWNIQRLFYAFDSGLDQQLSAEEVSRKDIDIWLRFQGVSKLTYVMDDLRILIEMRARAKGREKQIETHVRKAIRSAKYVLQSMEKNWQAVSKSVNELKLYCEA